MKYFTHPDGIFEIKLPLDWHYKNEVAGYENRPPFSFELFQDTKGCFQISCYHESEKKINPALPKNFYNVDKLKFIKSALPDPEFEILLWATVVEDYFFMAKYVCQPTSLNKRAIAQQVALVEKTLSTLMCLSPDRREFAISYDRFDKFNASLAASFDLKIKAMKSNSFIELIILSGNQIDAYLRLCVVLKLQIAEQTNLFRLEFLYQSESDRPIMEKTIYNKAKEMNILSEMQHKKLYELYDLRNKVVHRYIISDLKTMELQKISYDYELICEEIRLILARIESEQFETKLGYYGETDPHRVIDQDYVNELYSRVNDKHFSKDFHRKLE